MKIYALIFKIGISSGTVLFDDKTSQDYVEIGFMTTQNALQSEED